MMEILSKTKKMCLCCMEVHEVMEVCRSDRMVFKGEEIEYPAYYQYCSRADEYFADEERMSKNDISLKNAYRKKTGLLTSEDIAAVRKKYSISQMDLALLLGCGAKTITRYESHQVQDMVYDNILRKIDSDPEWFLYLLVENQNKFSVSAYKRYYESAMNLFAGKQDDYLRKSIIAQYAGYEAKEEYCGGTEIDLDKVIEMINYFALNVTNLYTAKLMKLLWYADALCFKRNNHSMSGLAYKALGIGAVPVAYQSIIELKGVLYEEVERDCKMEYRFVSTLKDYSKVSGDDKKMLEDIIEVCGNDTQSQIIKRMYNEKAYKKTCKGDIILYKYTKELSID